MNTKQQYDILYKTISEMYDNNIPDSDLNKINKTLSDMFPDWCKYYDALNIEKKELNKKINDLNIKCEKQKFKKIKEYFDITKEQHTCIDLLKALFYYYKNMKPNTKLYMSDFINLFEKTTMTTFKFKRQHVFEALCKLLLYFNYDKHELGTDKQFYVSLEKLIENPNTSALTKEDILESKINEGSKAGVVDIFFLSEQDEKINCKDGWMCDCEDPTIIKPKSNVKKSQYIMIQNKFYTEEKSDIDKYDISKIFTTATKLNELKDKVDKKIILMVNNEEALNTKLLKTKNKNKELIYKIYGLKSLEEWFRNLLSDFDSMDVFNEHLFSNSNKFYLTPRFHQELFTNITQSYNEKNYKLFIWGSVPRSGKSYMIANLISERNKPGHKVVVILGAKSETESQFIQMFKKFDNFTDYNIISPNNKRDIKNSSKYIYIFSQEYIKNKTDDKIKYLQNSNIDLFFDEIHKGGSTDKSQQILYSFKKNEISVNIFVMVTATFAKPHIVYDTHFIDEENKSKLIRWSYEDQQDIKNLKNETQKRIFINKRDDDDEQIILENLFNKYQNIYGTNYLNDISNQYKLHPELVMIQPNSAIDIKKTFMLKCNACNTKQSTNDYTNTTKIFKTPDNISELLNTLGNIYYNKLSGIYKDLEDMEAPISNTKSEPHTELWFLPDKNLYENPKECINCKTIKVDDNQDEDYDEQNSLPNIEPLCRGLALMIVKHKYFKDRYNVCIVHNSSLKYINIANDFLEKQSGSSIKLLNNSKDYHSNFLVFKNKD